MSFETVSMMKTTRTRTKTILTVLFVNALLTMTCFAGEPTNQRYYRVTLQETESIEQLSGQTGDMHVIRALENNSVLLVRTQKSMEALKRSYPQIADIEPVGPDQLEEILFDHRSKSMPDFLQLFFNFI
ncbi:MAG: hypothetical protein F6K11_19570 [Leptolyngbya sp. SIO3F4]|nr:hypothetical protein [Leptolyngbya sp. SIO3F4]